MQQFGSQATLIQKIATSLHQAVPEYSVETLFESRSNLSNTARVSISELCQLKPIAFRWTRTASAHDQLFFLEYPGRSEQTSWEKSHEALRVIGSTSNMESSLLFTPPSIPNHRKNQPSIVKRSILDFRLTTHYHDYPHLLSRHGQKSWSQYDGQFEQPQAIQNVQPLWSKTCCTWLASSPTAQASRTTILSLA